MTKILKTCAGANFCKFLTLNNLPTHTDVAVILTLVLCNKILQKQALTKNQIKVGLAQEIVVFGWIVIFRKIVTFQRVKPWYIQIIKKLSLKFIYTILTVKNVMKSFKGHALRTQNFPKTNISNPVIRKRTCSYRGVRNISLLENFAYVLNGWHLVFHYGGPNDI